MHRQNSMNKFFCEEIAMSQPAVTAPQPGCASPPAQATPAQATPAPPENVAPKFSAELMKMLSQLVTLR